jgi:hypothetical protein
MASFCHACVEIESGELSLVRLSLRALSVYGKKVAGSLKASEPQFNQHCSCPPGESCAVEITELPGRRFEVRVTRPRPVIADHGWSTIMSVTGMYRLLFDKRATAARMREAIAAIVGAPIEKSDPEPTTPSLEDLNIVLVDPSTLHKAQRLIGGCRMCSRYADIPFDSILDSVTGGDPTTTRYILAEGSVKCPRCRRNVRENSLVEYRPWQETEP